MTYTKAHFTLYSGVLLIFAAIFVSCQPSQFQQKARSDIRNLSNAVKFFVLERGYYPVPTNRLHDADLRVVLPILLALSDSDDAKRLNPHGSNYFGDIPPSRFINGECLDPWGSPYHLMLTTNTAPKLIVGSFTVCDNIAIWSNGHNKKNEMGGGDDICSWKN